MSNYSQDGRPALPLVQGIGSKGGEVGSGYALLRGARLLLVILNPLAAGAMWLFLLAFSRARRVRPWMLVVAGATATLVAVAVGWVGAYNTVWRELIETIGQAIRERDNSLVAQLAGEQWPTWLALQVPAAICLGLLLAGIVLTYRARYRATWREQTRAVSARKRARTAARLDREPGRGTLPLPRRVDTYVSKPDDLTVRFGVDVLTGEPFTFPGSALRMHAAVSGPTGFGKSTTLRRLIDQYVVDPSAREVRVPVVFIDMKADRGLRDYFERVAAAAGRRLHIITGEPGSLHYNPLRHGSGNELASLLMETEANAEDGGWTEPYYRSVGERLLRLAAAVLVELVDAGRLTRHDGTLRPWRRDVPDLVQLMDLGRLSGQVDLLSAPLARQLSRFLRETSDNKDLPRDVYGVYNRFALLAQSTAGDVLTDDGACLDLLAAIEAGDLVLFSLGSGDAAASRAIGNLAIQDLEKALGRLPAEFYDESAGGGMVLTVVDEFSALGGSLVAGLYARSRSAGGATVLASQTLYEDLAAVSPDFPAKVMKNANVVVIHQTRGDDAERWADFFGTHEVWKETIQLTSETGVLGRQDAASGMGSLRQAHEFRIAPDTLRELPRGRAAVFIAHPERAVTLVDVSPPRPLDPAPTVATTTAPTPAPPAAEVDTAPESPAETMPALVVDVVPLSDDVQFDGDDAPLIEHPER